MCQKDVWHQMFRTADKTDPSILTAKTEDPLSTRWKLLLRAVLFLLYEPWMLADALKMQIYRKRLTQVQRKAVLSMILAYNLYCNP